MSHFNLDWDDFEIFPLGQTPMIEAIHQRRRRWGQRHGPAVLVFQSDYVNNASGVRRPRHDPVGVDGALLPDGSRVRAEKYGGPVWRRPLDHHDVAWTGHSALAPVTWQFGHLDIADDDIRFIDVERETQTQFAPLWEPLERIIYSDRELRSIVRESVHAAQALARFCSMEELVRATDGFVAWGFDWGPALRLAADMRDLGEEVSELDLFLREQPDEDLIWNARERIAARLEELGWKRAERTERTERTDGSPLEYGRDIAPPAASSELSNPSNPPLSLSHRTLTVIMLLLGVPMILVALWTLVSCGITVRNLFFPTH